jgi:hypothetical protein
VIALNTFKPWKTAFSGCNSHSIIPIRIGLFEYTLTQISLKSKHKYSFYFGNIWRNCCCK